MGRSSNMQNVPFVYMQLTLMVERLRLPVLAENPRNIEKITYLYFFRLVKLQNVPFVYTMHLMIETQETFTYLYFLSLHFFSLHYLKDL